MPDITIIPANLVTLILESFLYGIVLLLFISTIYFLASRRTLAGKRQTARHHFVSLVFMGVTALFLVVTVHWTLVIYQAFFAFIHLGNKADEDAFYADLSQSIEVAKVALFSVAILIGDSLVSYRLWIVWNRARRVMIFPIVALLGVLVTCIAFIYQVTQWKPDLRGAPFEKEVRPTTGTGFVFSLLSNLYCTALIAFRISRVNPEGTVKIDSRLTGFMKILVESAGIQTFSLGCTAITMFTRSDAEFITSDTLPAIIGTANLLIHARVGLGWSPSSAGNDNHVHRKLDTP